MTWVKLDDQFASHPKAIAAGPEPMWLYVAGLCWCAQHLTDGTIPKAAVPMLAPVKRTAAAKLVEVGLWHDKGDEYEVNDYLDFQPSRAQVKADRDAARDRQRKSRARHTVTDAVTSPSPTRPDPTPLLESVSDDDDSAVPDSSSSWGEDALYIEAGRIAARSTTKPLKDFDDYATGCATKIRRERGYLVPRLRDAGYTLTEAAAVIAHRDAERLLETIGTWDFDCDFIPADRIEAEA